MDPRIHEDWPGHSGQSHENFFDQYGKEIQVKSMSEGVPLLYPEDQIDTSMKSTKKRADCDWYKHREIDRDKAAIEWIIKSSLQGIHSNRPTEV